MQQNLKSQMHSVNDNSNVSTQQQTQTTKKQIINYLDQ